MRVEANYLLGVAAIHDPSIVHLLVHGLALGGCCCLVVLLLKALNRPVSRDGQQNGFKELAASQYILHYAKGRRFRAKGGNRWQISGGCLRRVGS